DAAGRLWAGGINMDLGAGPGALYRVDGDGQWSVAAADVLFPNGLGWSPDGGTLYLVDSLRFALLAFDFDIAAGAVSGRRVVAELNPGAGFADGMCVDADGGIWLARLGMGLLERFDASGRVTEVVRVPGRQVTSA